MIARGACVVVHLGAPREQVFGVVLEVSAWGITVRGIGLSSVDDWLQALPDEAAAGALATVFYPMHRVEKVSLDEPSWGAPSLEERFTARTGLRLLEWLDARNGDCSPPARG